VVTNWTRDRKGTDKVEAVSIGIETVETQAKDPVSRDRNVASLLGGVDLDWRIEIEEKKVKNNEECNTRDRNEGMSIGIETEG